MDCPRGYDCFGCPDKWTGFCPIEEIEDNFKGRIKQAYDIKCDGYKNGK